MFPLEFRAEVNHEETRVIWLSSSEDPMIVAGVVLTQCQRLTDGQTDGQTDGRTDLLWLIQRSAVCIASYADALQFTDYSTYTERSTLEIHMHYC